MKKVTKAAVAAGAAGVLLLGGAGSFALWNDTKTVDAGTVNTGHLTLDASAPGAWADISADAENALFVPTTDKIVPGDTVTFTQTVTIDADGKNLKGELTVGTLAAVPAALTDQVTVTVAPTAAAGVTVDGSVVSFDAPGIFTVPVTITVNFLEGAAGSTPETTMVQEVNLNALELTLDQVRP
ncbi:hypothetical protein AS189_16390 [Arthrobacter alpinus]|uniref:Alternate signal-mediated exported protein, RER_14450 family n=1 Tax=Arthrobacter alpinus TaxID=656366 RepID=A0A0S2M2X5_9MICC|nr:alternate-type signal peptide domain-containing protein [Arthrobacter alpinus]ALO67767.1 hypothetical protein AS189_16390 [Arthrobacter alpinus]